METETGELRRSSFHASSPRTRKAFSRRRPRLGFVRSGRRSPSPASSVRPDVCLLVVRAGHEIVFPNWNARRGRWLLRRLSPERLPPGMMQRRRMMGPSEDLTTGKARTNSACAEYCRKLPAMNDYSIMLLHFGQLYVQIFPSWSLPSLVRSCAAILVCLMANKNRNELKWRQRSFLFVFVNVSRCYSCD